MEYRLLGSSSCAVSALALGTLTFGNETGWQLQKAVGIAEFRGLSVPVSMQPQYNLLARAIEWEIAPACQAAGLGMLAWTSLARRARPVPAQPPHPGREILRGGSGQRRSFEAW
jgi:aryl-alcohol dehydrogenase-like predicted oxidoreductase